RIFGCPVAQSLRDLLWMDESATWLDVRQLVQASPCPGVVILRSRQVCAVPLSVESRQQRCERGAHVPDDAEVHRSTAPDVFGPQIHLHDSSGIAVGIELAIWKVRAEHQQEVAIAHGVVARGKANEPGHAYVKGVVPLDVLLAS